jgi:ribosomal-protein-alanine N-acetyltransferase
MIDKKQIVDTGNSVMKKLFGVEPGWHKELDIVKNNYLLARRYIAQGNYKDAVFRLKFLVWLDPEHKAGWLDLARSHIALENNMHAARALSKLLKLDPQHAEGNKLKAAMATGKVVIAPKLEIGPEMDAKLLHQVHRECFPIFWKEQEISDMLMTSGTKAWLARAGLPVGMLMTRSQFEQAEILTICVTPKSQHTGIASKMMKASEQDMANYGVKKIFLEVAANNPAAIGLYTKLGYAETNRRKGYYKQPDGTVVDALVMSKELGA